MKSLGFWGPSKKALYIKHLLLSQKIHKYPLAIGFKIDYIIRMKKHNPDYQIIAFREWSRPPCRFREGIQAAKDGKSITDNPYDGLEGTQWKIGFTLD